MQHNQKHLQFDDTEELYLCSKSLADIIIPQVNFFYIYMTDQTPKDKKLFLN